MNKTIKNKAIHSKNCLNCNQLFYKKASDSVKIFQDTRKFCCFGCFREYVKKDRVIVDNEKVKDHRDNRKDYKLSQFLSSRRGHWLSTKEIAENTGITRNNVISLAEKAARSNPSIFTDVVHLTDRQYQFFFGWFASEDEARKTPPQLEYYYKRSLDE